MKKNAELKVVHIETKPHIVLFACRNICQGEEIRFDYGVKDLPWRTECMLNNLKNTNKQHPLTKECTVALRTVDLGAREWYYEKEDGTSSYIKNARYQLSRSSGNKEEENAEEHIPYEGADSSIIVKTRSCVDIETDSNRSALFAVEKTMDSRDPINETLLYQDRKDVEEHARKHTRQAEFSVMNTQVTGESVNPEERHERKASLTLTERTDSLETINKIPHFTDEEIVTNTPGWSLRLYDKIVKQKQTNKKDEELYAEGSNSNEGFSVLKLGSTSVTPDAGHARKFEYGARKETESAVQSARKCEKEETSPHVASDGSTSTVIYSRVDGSITHATSSEVTERIDEGQGCCKKATDINTEMMNECQKSCEEATGIKVKNVCVSVSNNAVNTVDVHAREESKNESIDSGRSPAKYFVATKLCAAINNSNWHDVSKSTGECQSQNNMSSFVMPEGKPAVSDILDELQHFSGIVSSSSIYDAEEQHVPKHKRERGEQTDVSELNSNVIINKDTEKAKDDLQNNESDVGVNVQCSTIDIEPLPRSNKKVNRKFEYGARKETTESAVQSARKCEKEETIPHVASDEMENVKDGIQNDDGELIIHCITIEESKPTPRSNEHIKRQLEHEVKKERSKPPVQSTEGCEKVETSQHVVFNGSTSTVIYSRVDGSITNATSSEVTEMIDEEQGCCEEATDINTEMMNEGQKSCEEATGIKVKSAVAKTRAKCEKEHERERPSKEHEIQRIDNENWKEIGTVEKGSLETTSELSVNSKTKLTIKESQRKLNTVTRSRKPHRPCPYCHSMKSALSKHLIKMHHNEVEVKHAIALPKQDRNRALTLLKRKGIMTKNMTMLRNKPQAKKDLIRERKSSTLVNEQLTYCSKCFGFFSKTYFHKHRRTCHLNESSIYLPYPVQPENAIVDNAALEKYQTEVLDHFYNDDIGIICKSDEVINAYGKKKFQKLLAKKDIDKYDDKKTNIRSEMRRVGHLFKQFQEICEKNKTSCVSSLDMFKRGNFYHLEEAIEQMTTNPDGSIKAGPRKDIGYLIKRVCYFLHGKFSVEENEEKVAQLDKFLNVLTFYWADIFGEAEASLVVNRETKLRKPLNLPKQKDVKLLRDYTLSKIKILTDDKYNFIASKEYKMLRTLVISRLTLFNARRGGEPSCLLIRQWKDAENNVWLTENEQGEDPADKALIGKFKVAYQSGKGGKLVPLLILNDCWEAMRKLCDDEIRLQAGIHPQNNYVFPQTQYSTNHALGWQAVQECCVLAGLGNKVNATTMRHYVSTVYASLEVSETERETFYAHMGHSAEMNKHVYQSPQARQEITRVGKFLHELDQGSTSTVIYSRIDGSITHATSSEVTERIDEGQGCCKEATDINTEMMNEGQKSCEEATGIKVKSAVAKTRAKCEKEHERERPSKEHEIQRIDNENWKEICTVEKGSLETTTSELSMNVCVSVSNNAVNTVDVHAREECKNESIDSGRSPAKYKRQYQLWCKQDTETIRSYFNEYILSLEHLDSNKGNLPGVIELKAFLEKFPNILHGLAKKERISKLRTKIFNERKLAREKVQRAVKRGKAKHKVDDTEI